MIKLKNILSEAYAWERQEGKSLPTLAEVQAAYNAKMQEDANLDKDQNNNGYPDSTDGSMNNKNKLHDLYGRIYDFTAHAGDSALDLMEDIINSEGLMDVFERYLDDNAKLSDDEATKLAECFEVVIDECNEEFGEYDEDEYDSMDESKADKDYDGDGELESGSEEYLGSRDKAIKAASKSNTTLQGNIVNRGRAKSKDTWKDSHVYGHDSSGDVTKLNSPSDADNAKYKKFTIKSKDDDDLHEYGGQDSDGIHADGPKNPFSDVRDKEQMIESFNKRMLGNLHGHEYILREAFKRN